MDDEILFKNPLQEVSFTSFQKFNKALWAMDEVAHQNDPFITTDIHSTTIIRAPKPVVVVPISSH